MQPVGEHVFLALPVLLMLTENTTLSTPVLCPVPLRLAPPQLASQMVLYIKLQCWSRPTAASGALLAAGSSRKASISARLWDDSCFLVGNAAIQPLFYVNFFFALN